MAKLRAQDLQGGYSVGRLLSQAARSSIKAAKRELHDGEVLVIVVTHHDRETRTHVLSGRSAMASYRSSRVGSRRKRTKRFAYAVPRDVLKSGQFPQRRHDDRSVNSAA